ncbi:MAG: hypothetical protein MHM6MM_002777 [Cercozoa sp. M6MM]
MPKQFNEHRERLEKDTHVPRFLRKFKEEAGIEEKKSDNPLALGTARTWSRDDKRRQQRKRNEAQDQLEKLVSGKARDDQDEGPAIVYDPSVSTEEQDQLRAMIQKQETEEKIEEVKQKQTEDSENKRKTDGWRPSAQKIVGIGASKKAQAPVKRALKTSKSSKKKKQRRLAFDDDV